MAMSEAKIIEVSHKYESLLRGLGYEPARLDHSNDHRIGITPSHEHLLFMAIELRTLLAEGRREKVMRWMGFIQGAMWQMGLRSIEEMKRDNMPDAEAA